MRVTDVIVQVRHLHAGLMKTHDIDRQKWQRQLTSLQLEYTKTVQQAKRLQEELSQLRLAIQNQSLASKQGLSMSHTQWPSSVPQPSTVQEMNQLRLNFQNQGVAHNTPIHASQAQWANALIQASQGLNMNGLDSARYKVASSAGHDFSARLNGANLQTSVEQQNADFTRRNNNNNTTQAQMSYRQMNQNHSNLQDSQITQQWTTASSQPTVSAQNPNSPLAASLRVPPKETQNNRHFTNPFSNPSSALKTLATEASSLDVTLRNHTPREVRTEWDTPPPQDSLHSITMFDPIWKMDQSERSNSVKPDMKVRSSLPLPVLLIQN